jgi:hypothetical protein
MEMSPVTVNLVPSAELVAIMNKLTNALDVLKPTAPTPTRAPRPAHRHPPHLPSEDPTPVAPVRRTFKAPPLAASTRASLSRAANSRIFRYCLAALPA